MNGQLRLLFAVCCCIVSLKTQAQPTNMLDPAFANGGIGIYSMGTAKITNKAAKVILSQPDGKIIIAGTIMESMVIVRLNADQTVDGGFGENGVTFAKTGVSSKLSSAVLQPDGKILFAGNNDNGTYNDFSVVRLNGNGSMDNNFGNNGKVLISGDSFHYRVNSIALQSNGKILLAGSSSKDFFAMRLNSNGGIDNSFDGDGKVRIQMGDYEDYAESVAAQPDGKILLAGVRFTSYNHNDGADFAVVRLTSNGTLDKSFSDDGKLVLADSSYDYAQAVTLQNDGKILVAGYRKAGNTNRKDCILLRLNENGAPDTGFDEDGEATLPGNASDQATPIALQPDGKVLVAGLKNAAGNYPMDFLVARLKTNGKPDRSFDGDGQAVVNKEGNDHVNSIALQPDGKILVAGCNTRYGYYDNFSIARLDSNGHRDSFFSTYWLDQQKYGSGGSALCTALQSDGKILLAGYSAYENDDDFSVVRLDRNGKLDSSFDGDGKLRTPGKSYGDGYSEIARAIALQPDGKIVLAGNSAYFYSETVEFGAMRLNRNGSIDSSFNGVGKVRVPAIGYNLDVTSMVLQRDGKILMAGNSTNDYNKGGFCVVRLNNNGSLDNSFDGDGKLWLQTGNSDDNIYSIAVQPDGKIVLAGFSRNTDNGDFLVVRLRTDGSLDKNFGSDGTLVLHGDYFEVAQSIALQPDGKILLAGKSYDDYSNTVFFTAVRLNRNGSSDNTFGSGGKVLIAGGIGAYNMVNTITLQPDGKILLAGSSKNGSNEDFCAVRLNSDGSLDSNFNDNGKAIVETPYFAHANASVLQPDGNLIITGYGEGDAPGDNFIAMRLLGCNNAVCSLPEIKISDATTKEGNADTKNIKFLVTLSQASSQTVTVNYATQNGTAKSTNDYTAKTGTLVFEPGTIIKTIPVKINADAELEPDESFKVNLSNAVNATIIDEKAMGTIVNDDGAAISSEIAADALQESKNKKSLKISPNPADAVLKVELFGYMGRVTLQLQSLQGRILIQEKVQLEHAGYMRCRMNVADLANGIYLLHVFDEHGKQQTGKVIVGR